MNIYVIFENKEKIPVFDLEISQEEGFFAKAKLKIEAGTPLPPYGAQGIIQGNSLYFKGLLLGAPLNINGYFSEIELMARPPDFLEHLKLFQKERRIAPYWDALWVKDPDKIEDLQDVHTSSLYCDRRTWELKVSDWFEGREILNVQQNFFPDSLHLRIIKKPLRACTVKVHAYWIQKEEGVADLSRTIRLAFPYSKVNTYTKEALLQKWPEPGQRIGRSGIWVLKSNLKEIDPSSSFYPHYSPSLFLGEEENKQKPYRAKRHWFKPTLWVSWSYHQRRKETLHITLHHTFQPLYPEEGEHKIVEFTLQNINPDPNVYSWRPEVFYKERTKVFYKNTLYQCKIPHTADMAFDSSKWTLLKIFHTALGNPARASFFLTDRGYCAAEHAMERAKAILAKSARAIEISFEAPWEILQDVTTDTSLILTDPRLPGGDVRGKVSKYSLIAKGETGERFGRVTLVCAVGTPSQEGRDKDQYDRVSVEDYCEDFYQVHENRICQTPSGLQYFRYDTQISPSLKREGPLLRRVDLNNSPDEQELEILKQTGKTPRTLIKALSHKPTHLRLHFKDLRTKETSEHSISVIMAAPWSGPQQVKINNS